MKKGKIIVSILCALAMFGVGTTTLTSCKKEKESTEETIKFTVTFNSNGGSTVPAVEIEKGNKVTVPTAPTKADSTFAGWYKDSNCTQEWKFDTDTVTGNITLYAKWTAKGDTPVEKYTVTFDSKGGYAVAKLENIESGAKITKPTNDPTKDNYLFDGWYKSDPETDSNAVAWKFDTDTVTANITLYAKWEENKVVSIEVSGADEETYEYNKEYVRSSSIKVTATYTDGHTVDLDNDAEISYSLSSADETGTKICTVTYENVSTTYPVHIVKLSATAVEDGKIFMNGTEYTTIKEAFAAIPAASSDMYTITLGKGTYNENGLMYKGSATIRIVGSTEAKYGSDVIIKGHGSKMPGETGCDSKNRCLISIQGSANIILENLTLESDWYRADHSGDVQAEVLGTDTSGNTAAYNCGFKSHQDTLRTIGKAWFYGCYIEGDVDFIWMEAGGKVALYENCEIVSVWDAAANTHNTYITAPKMAETLKLGKGLVIYNSTVKESAEAKENGQKTYLARTPWSSGCYNQVAYINTTCEGIELTDGPWYKSQIATPFAKTTVGWKMDKATADSIGITNQETKDYILDADTVAVEFNGRNAILNRIFDTGKLRYVTDTTTNWDTNALIGAMGWTVAKDNSSDKLEGDTMGEAKVYDFKVDGANGAVCEGFTFQDNNGNTHYVAQAGGTITIPVNGKCYVEVYGYYAGVVEATADTQEGKMIMFFNNASTNSEVENDFIVYDENATSFVITAKATTYITKIVVTPDSAIEDKKVESLTITNLKPKQIVGVPQTLTVEMGPKGVINTSVLWSSSDETIATVDPYTGKVTFLKEGNVTITATACDGSGVSASVDCNPIIPNWTAIEWYTSDKVLDTENGADGIDMFDVNASANKKLSQSYTFTNLAGKKITSNYGLKLNSAGKLSFATLKYAEVTLIVAPQQNQLVNPPVITNADGTKAILLSQYVDETTKLQHFKYALTATGMWDIVRLDATMENNPILYAKVEYASDVITESVGITFKGTQYNTSNTGIQTIITPGSSIDANNTTTQFYKLNLTNCASNGSAENWLQFNTGAKIEFKVEKATTLLVGYYSKIQTVKLDGVVVEGNKTSVANGAGEIVMYEITAGGVVTIEATANDYLGFVGVHFILEEKKEEACSNLDKAYPAANYSKNLEYEKVLNEQKDLIKATKTQEELDEAKANAVVEMNKLLTNDQIDAMTIVSIAVSNIPAAVAKDSVADLSGIVVTATYADGHPAPLESSQYEFTPVDTSVATTIQVTVTVKETTISTKFDLVISETIATYNVSYVTEMGIQPDMVENVTALPQELPILTDTTDQNKFIGWYTDEERTIAAVAGSVLSQDATLYAKWESLADLMSKALASLDTDYPSASYTVNAAEYAEAMENAKNAISGAQTITDLEAAITEHNAILIAIKSDAAIEALAMKYSFAIDPTADGGQYYVAPSDNVVLWENGATSIGSITITGSLQSNGNSVQAKADTTFVFTVEAGTTVVITGYPQYSEYTINGRTATDTCETYFSAATEVTVVLKSGKYLCYIDIKPETKGTDAVVESIEVIGAPTQSLELNTELDTSGIKVKQVYSDGSYALTNDFTVDTTKVDNTTAGIYEVTVTCGELTGTFNVEYTANVETRIVKTTNLTFKGGSYSGDNLINANSAETIQLTTAETTYERFTFTGCQSNGADNWLVFNTGARIVFTVAEPCTLKLAFYGGANNATVTINGNVVTTTTAASTDYTTKYAYAITEVGEVVIEAAANGYLGFLGVELNYVVATTSLTFKGGSYSGENLINANSDATILLTQAETTYEGFTYTGCKSNGADNWLAFNQGAKIVFHVTGPCTIKLAFYNGANNAAVTINGNAVTTATTAGDYTTLYEYALTEAGEVVITAASNGYLGFLGVVYE